MGLLRSIGSLGRSAAREVAKRERRDTRHEAEDERLRRTIDADRDRWDRERAIEERLLDDEREEARHRLAREVDDDQRERDERARER